MKKDFSILIVEDEDSIASFMMTELSLEGYQVNRAKDGQQAIEMFKQGEYNLLLLDWMLPIYDGMRVLRIIRQQSNVPVIMLTARDTTEDLVQALDNGSDVYITKPFEIEELLAQVRAMERRITNEKKVKLYYSYGGIDLDLTKHRVFFENEIIDLTPTEFNLLYELIKQPETVRTRDELLNTIWGVDYDGQNNIVDVYIRTLRNKLGKAASLLQTIRGVGYVLRNEHE